MNFLYENKCTGKFRKRIQRTILVGWLETIYHIDQEVESNFLFKRNKWIPLKVDINGIKFEVSSNNESNLDKIYNDVIDQYKPILREKRLKKLLQIN